MEAAPSDADPQGRERRGDAEDRLFDEFLEQALAGAAGDPAAFCRERGIAAPPAWLQQLHGLVQESAQVPAAAAGGRPQRIGDYVLLRQLGEGGMGVVYLAEQQSLRRHVALKVVRAELASSATAAQRFTREAHALARLRHPGIATVYEAGEADGVRFLAMELIPGRDLAAILREGPPAIPQMVGWLRDIAEALAAAHAAGVLHRDVKPQNIRIGPEGRAVLMDFGLARDLHGVDATLTQSFAGSPSYAAPEQLTGARPVDARTDVYGLGATLYECLAGAPPFPGSTLEQVMRCALTEDARPPRRPGASIPRDLEAVVLRALERDPARRYASAAEFAADLGAILALRPVRARRRGPWRLLRGFCQRHRLLAFGLAAAGLVALTLPAVLFVDGVRLRAAQRREALRLVGEAREALDGHDAVRRQAAEAAERLRALDQRLVERWLNPGEESARQRFTAAASLVGSEREQVFARVLGALHRAQELDPAAPGLERGWAELHFQQWLDLQRRDPDAASVHRQRVGELDRAGDLASRVLGVQSVSLVSEPEGAEVLLFQWRNDAEVGGEQRLVPHAEGMPKLGLSLRVLSPHGLLRPGDLVTAVGGQAPSALVVKQSALPAVAPGAFLCAVDGAAPAIDDLEAEAEAGPARRFRFVDRTGAAVEIDGIGLSQFGIAVEPVWQALRRGVLDGASLRALRDGAPVEDIVHGAVEVAPTHLSIVPVPAARLGSTPLAELVLAPGSYLAVLRCAGHLDYLLPFHVDHAVLPYSRPRVFRAELQRHAEPGFVPIGGEAFALPAFFLQRHEVRNGDYLAFLRAGAPPDDCVPIDARTADARRWPVGADGRVELPAGLDPEHPVCGVTWHAARRYAAWFTRERGLEGSEWVCDLPDFAHFARAGHGGDGRTYVHGSYFNPKWIKSRFARRAVGLEPVQSFPVDESPYGVFDLQGSVAEWAADVENPVSDDTRVVFGGSWADAMARSFQLRNYRTLPPAAAKGWVGFRLVMRRRR